MSGSSVTADALVDLATLVTPRLSLVPLGPEHLEPSLASLSDADSLRLTGTRGSFDRASVVRHLESLASRADRADWAILDRVCGRYLGEVVLNELDEDNSSMNFRIALTPGSVGKGYGTEATLAVLDHAFKVLGLHRVSLDVYSFNPRAERSYEKAGFRVEGRQRHTLLWDGEWVDSIMMSVLSSDSRPRA